MDELKKSYNFTRKATLVKQGVRAVLPFGRTFYKKTAKIRKKSKTAHLSVRSQKKGISEMQRYTMALFIVILTSVYGCATAASPAREAFILAKSHGWVDIKVEDNTIPAKPMGEGNKYQLEPVSCNLTLTINGEIYLSEQLYPLGENPPYSINTGFRITVPTGNSKIVLSYNSCKVNESQISNISTSMHIIVEENMVTPIMFDGSLLSAGEVEKNKVVTLESIDERLKSIESRLGVK